MGKATGFLEYARVEEPFRPEAERLKDFSYLHAALPAQARRQQAARCMNCGVPFCQSGYGCPLNNRIPEWNDRLYQGRTREALERLLLTAPFPEFTGRVCPQLCEKACMLGDDATTQPRQRTLYHRGRLPQRLDHAPRARAPHGQGAWRWWAAAPGGLAAADLLNRLGHRVTVVERADRPGGLLMYGIPNMKLPKEIVARRVGLMKAEGRGLLPAYRGRRLFARGIRRGAPLRRRAARPATGGSRRERKRRGAGRGLPHPRPPAPCWKAARPRSPRRARTCSWSAAATPGNDCVATCLRQGCRSVAQLEMLPAPPERRAKANPWPEWPRVLRTELRPTEAIAAQGRGPAVYSKPPWSACSPTKMAISALWKRCASRAGRMVARTPPKARAARCPVSFCSSPPALSAANRKSPSASPFPERPPPSDIPAGTHVLAPGLFVAGDMRGGPSLVVRALADGRAAAMEAHRYLGGAAL